MIRKSTGKTKVMCIIPGKGKCRNKKEYACETCAVFTEVKRDYKKALKVFGKTLDRFNKTMEKLGSTDVGS